MSNVTAAAALILMAAVAACDRPPPREAVTELGAPAASTAPGPTTAATAGPAGPGAALGVTGGELVFQSDRDGRPKLYGLKLDTGTAYPLTTDQSWRDEAPRVSPDRRLVAFSTNRYDHRVFEIATLDLASGEVRRLTRFADDAATSRNERHARDPAWSPDGRVYFAWGREGQEDIYRVAAAGGSPEQVTDTLTRAIMPAVSPDGRYLAYALQSIRRLGAFQIEILDLTTHETRTVDAAGGACRPAWSPDGSRLAYVVLDEEPSTIEAFDPASGATRRLFADPVLWAYYPSFSPDGRFLSFSVSPAHHEGEDWDLAVLDLARPERFVRVTTGRGNDRLADWR